MTGLAEKFQEILIPVVQNLLPSLESLFGFIGDNINGIITAMKVVIPLVIAYKAASIAASIAQIAGASALSGGAALAISLGAATAAGIALTNIGDGDFPARGKNLISTKEGGLFQPSINDDIVVAPGASQALRQGGTQKVENKVSIAPSDTNITLNLNGAAIGNANARQNYGVGKNVKALGGNVDYSASI